MKKYFVTGLVILLPLAVTLLVVFFIFNLLTEPFVGIVKSFLDYHGLMENGFLFLSADQIQKYFSQLIIIVLLFIFTVALGWLARWFFVNYLIRIWDSAIHRIPFISSLYKACQDVIKSLFTSKNKSFKQVVLVPFPSADTLAIGFITKDDLPPIAKNGQGDALTAVFVPTTPNPTSGFLMMFKKQDLIYLDMRVEDAFKYVISCGMISSPLTPLTAKEAQRMSQRLQNEDDENLPSPKITEI